MATNFPGSLDDTSVLKDDAVDATLTETTHANAHNNIADAVIAVETALGTNPKGSYADVKTWLTDAVVKTPGSGQTITPSADVVALTVKQGNNTYTSDLQEWKSSTNSVLAYISSSGGFSAQTLSVAGTLLNSTHLSDAGKLQKKGKIASNIASSSESMAVGWDIVQGVTPGRTTATPQNTLQVTAPGGTWVLNIHLGAAHIQGTDDDAQGMYAIAQEAATTVTFSTHAPTTNNRWDAVIVEYNDSYYTARTPQDAFTFLQVVGNESASASMTGPNLTGAPGQAGGPSLPNSCLLLAYVLVQPSDSSGPQSGNVLDRRILSGPAIWGEDNHKYRISVDANGNLFLGQVS